MRIKTETNLAKRILCLALCAIMLIAMLPAMTVPAYAAKPISNEATEVEYGSLWIEYYDIYSGDLLSSTIIHYEDLDNGEYSVEPQLISGYSLVRIEKYSGAAEGTPHDRATVSNGKWETIMGQSIEGVMPSSGAAVKYKVYYENDKAHNGFITVIRKEGTTVFEKSILYMDDFDTNGIRVDVKVPGYKWLDWSQKNLQATTGGRGLQWYNGESFVDNDSVNSFNFPDASNLYALVITSGTQGELTLVYERNTSTASFNSVLLLNENSSVPSVTIDYSIAPGTGIAAVPGTSMAVLAPSADTGVTGTPTISNAVFAPGDATVTSVEGVTIDAGKKAVVKPISIDFSDVTFAQPGIFRYVISEPSSGNNMTYDTQLNDTTNGTRYQRVLDVYVVRNASNEYEIGGYVMHEVANAPAEGATAASDKSSGFVNEYNTSGITLECLVTGNQSSVEKYFKFNVVITNPGGSQFSSAIDWSNAAEAKNPVENPATTYSQSDIASANEANTWTSTSAGVLEKVVYLKHGQKIEIPGLPIGATYHIDVLEEDYGPTWDIKIDGTVKDQPAGSDPLDDTENQTLGERTEDVRFILTRDGIVPTGIMLSAMPGVIIMGAAAAVLFVMKNRKKEEGAEA